METSDSAEVQSGLQAGDLVVSGLPEPAQGR